MNNFKIDIERTLKIKRVWIPIYQLEEGIEFAINNKIEALYIFHGGKLEPPKHTVDFNFLLKIPTIKSLDFLIRLTENSNIEGIYSLKNLTNLTYFEYDSFPLNHSKIQSLRYLYTHFSRNHLKDVSKFSHLKNLDTLKIWHVKNEDCNFLVETNNLENIEITWGTLKSLKGIDKLTKLQKLSLYGLNKLTDIESIFQSKSLKLVGIEKCKSIPNDWLERYEKSF